jgi:hypothetical protein
MAIFSIGAAAKGKTAAAADMSAAAMQQEPEPLRSPQIRAVTATLRAGAQARDFRVMGNFVYVDTAATSFELSLDGANFIPMREGRMIQTRHDFDTLYLRAAAADVTCVLILGYGGISTFASYGGGIGSSNAAPLMPYDSPAALGNAPSAELNTGVYAIIIDGSPPSARTWQLRAWTGPAAPETDPENGIIVPVDHSAANNRVWFRV